jgi:hypothetical protein
VTANEGRESLVTAPGEEVGEKLFIGRRGGGQAADVLQENGVSQHGAALGSGGVRHLIL